MSAPMKLRPHHLLCTQGFSGNGYSPEFVVNMTRYVTQMRTDPDFEILLTNLCDDLCICCPNRIDEVRCEDDAKVLHYDQKVLELFQLEVGKVYRYQDLIRQIDDAMTPEKMNEICGNCNWFQSSACLPNMLSHRYVLDALT